MRIEGTTTDTPRRIERGGVMTSGIRVSVIAQIIEVSVGDGPEEYRATIRLDANHAEALEYAIRCARLEVQARAIGP